MANKPTISKRLQIDKANSTMIVAISVSAFVIVFSLVASKALWNQRGYQSRVIAKKETARNTLKKNIESVSTLRASYTDFVGAPENFLGGNPAGQGDKDGDNAKLILDALPSKYDYPALTNSLEKLLTEKSFKINSITGVDDEKIQKTKNISDNPQPVDMPIVVNINGKYSSIQELFATLEHSIRPFHVQKIVFSGSQNDLAVDINIKTYFQPEKSLKIKTEEVK